MPPIIVIWNSLLKSAAGTPPTAVVTPLNVTHSPSSIPDVIFKISTKLDPLVVLKQLSDEGVVVEVYVTRIGVMS